MSEEVRKRIERKPVEALAIANLATSIAESLPASLYPPPVMGQVRSTALRDRANALRYLGRLEEAYDSIETAESRLQALGTGACPAASVLGQGRAVVAAFIGPQLVIENVSLRLFLGPLQNLQPTVEVFGEGLSPFAEQVDDSAKLSAGRGSQLVR